MKEICAHTDPCEGIDTWIRTYILLQRESILVKGRGMLVVPVADGECLPPTFATLASCNDENLSRFGIDHAEAEVIRTAIRSYDEDQYLPVLVLSEVQSRFDLFC